MGVHAVTVVLATLLVVMGTKAALTQLTCSFNSPRAATQKNVTISDLLGTWYTVYTSLSSTDVSNIKAIKMTMMEFILGPWSFIQLDRHDIDTNNKCSYSVRYHDLSANKGYFYATTLMIGGVDWDVYNYVMGVDSNVLLMYRKWVKQGLPWSQTLYVMAKDPTASIALTSTMKQNANALCGGTAAANLSSYTSVNADISATC